MQKIVRDKCVISVSLVRGKYEIIGVVCYAMTNCLVVFD